MLLRSLFFTVLMQHCWNVTMSKSFTVCSTEADHNEHHEHHDDNMQHLWDEWSAHGVYYPRTHWLINKTQRLLMETMH